MNGNDRTDRGEQRDERRITTDREDIRRWADERNAALVSGDDTGTDEHRYRFVDETDAREGRHEQSWDDFFDWFESDDRAFVYSEDHEGVGQYEILDRDEAAARAIISDSDVEERLLEGETVTTEVTERTVVEREVVETDQLETEVVDRELVSSRIMDAKLVDWEVLDTGSDFELRAADDIVGREVTMTGDADRFDYADVDLGTHLDGYLTADIEEVWEIRRVVDEQATVETRIVDTDVEEHGTVESDTVETQIDTEDVHRTVLQSDAVTPDIGTESDTADLMRTERLGDDQFESVLVERQMLEDDVRRRKRFRFENVDSELLETQTIDTEIVETEVVESEYDEATSTTGAAGMTETAGSPEQTADTDTDSTSMAGTEFGRSFSDDDEGTTVVAADGDKIGKIDHVDAGTAYVNPQSGLVDSISSALGWGGKEDEYQLRPEQVRSIDDRGRFVVSYDAGSSIKHGDDRP